MTQGFCDFLLGPGGGGCCGESAGRMVGADLRSFFLLRLRVKMKLFNSIKDPQGPKFSLMYS